MFRNITIGQFYPCDSILHRLDPRVKLLGVVVYIASLFVINNIWGFIFIFLVLLGLIKLSNVPVNYILRGMKVVWFIIIIAVIFNLFFTEGDLVLAKWWIFTISTKGILNALFFAIRLIFIIVGASLLTYTTTPTSLTEGMEKVFSPLKKIHFPAHEIAMMMSIALRFIPILAEEAGKITKAQTSRGADFDTGGIVAKAKGMIPILVPLFVSAFKRANDLACAMEARCYKGGEGRTKMYPLKYESRDKIAYFTVLGYVIVFILIRILMDMFVTSGRI